MQGIHLTADLCCCRCDPAWLLDAEQGLAACLLAVRSVGLQAVGYTATVLLADSHLCLHTWPEQHAVTLDVYVCNFSADHSAKANALMDSLLTLFMPGQVTRQALQRGSLAVPA